MSKLIWWTEHEVGQLMLSHLSTAMLLALELCEIGNENQIKRMSEGRKKAGDK